MEREFEHRITELEQKAVRTESRLNKLEKVADVEHRLTATEDREKANTRRIEKLENVVEAIHDMSNTMVRLVEQIKTTNENVQELKVKVDAIEQEPVDSYKSLKKTVITCIVTAVVSAIVGAVIGLII
jgi:chromosome segregation ATPase